MNPWRTKSLQKLVNKLENSDNKLFIGIYKQTVATQTK